MTPPMKGRHVAIAILIAAIWGSAFVAMKVGLETLPPLMFAAARFLVASLPIMLLRRRPDVGWRRIIIIGLTLGTCQFGFLFVGIHLGLPAGLASLVLQAQAAFTVILGFFVLGDIPTPRRIAGMMLCFSGLAVIGIERGFNHGSVIGFLAVLAGAAGFAMGNIAIKQSATRRPFELIVWTSLIPPLPLMALSWLFEGSGAIEHAMLTLNPAAVAAVLYVAASTIVGFGLWSKLLSEYGPATVAPFGLLVPFFGISATTLAVGERLNLTDLGMGLVIVTGLYLVIRPGRQAGNAATSTVRSA